jgi:drug/metabolite transporter (DMT)-like permease
MSNTNTRSAYLQLHTAVFLFGFTGILGDIISLDATMLVWHRMWMTSIMMFLYVWFIKKWRLLGAAETLKIAAVSLAIVIHWILFYASIKLASVSVAMICLSSITLFTALLEPLILKKQFSKIELLFSVLVIVGVYFMADDQKQHVIGIFVGLASAFFSALFTVLNKRLVGQYDSRLLSLYELSAGFVLLTLLLPVTSLFIPVASYWPTTNDWFYLFLLSFFCTVVAFNLSLSSLRHLSPFTVNLAINLEPVYGIALAFVLLKEYRELGSGFYIGALFILLAVLLELIWKQYQKKQTSTEEFV